MNEITLARNPTAVGRLRHQVCKRLAQDGKFDMLRLLTRIVAPMQPEQIAELIIDHYSDAELRALAESYELLTPSLKRTEER